MSFYLYPFLIISAIIFFGIIFFIIASYKRNRHTELYSAGVRYENAGDYNQAIYNYENALNEILKRNPDKKFADKISRKIKILQTTIDYEKNFHTVRVREPNIK